MKHELHQELHGHRFFFCDPARWYARLARIDKALTEHPEFANPLKIVRIARGTDMTEINAALSEGEDADREGAGQLHAGARVLPGTEAGAVVAGYGDDDDTEYDVWGDPIPEMEMVGSVAVIPIKGLIMGGMPKFFKRFGVVDLDDVAEDVEEAMEDPNCKAILFACDSPGGGLRSLPEFAGMVAAYAAAGDKTIAARIDGLGCSALYYAIAGCNLISAAPSSELVNIGVYQANVDVSRAYEAFGYKVQIFKSGNFKAAGYPGTSLTGDQEKEIQATVEDLGAMFRAQVAAGRPSADVANMQGQTFLGTKAMELGFSDDDAPTFAAFLTRYNAYLDGQ